MLPPVSLVGLVAHAALFAPIIFRFLSRTLPSLRIIRNSARLWNRHSLGTVCLCQHCFLLLWASYVHQRLFRMIWPSLHRDCIDYPALLAGYHDQRLHLLYRIFRSRRIVGMEFFKFLCMGHCRLGGLEQSVAEPFVSTVVYPRLAFVLA